MISKRSQDPKQHLKVKDLLLPFSKNVFSFAVKVNKINKNDHKSSRNESNFQPYPKLTKRVISLVSFHPNQVENATNVQGVTGSESVDWVIGKVDERMKDKKGIQEDRR